MPSCRLAVPFSACLTVLGLLASEATAAAPGTRLISADSLDAYGVWLADDAREGRFTGSPGCEAAGAWVAERFAGCGLEPAGDDGTWFQNFQATVGVKIAESGNAMEVRGIGDAGAGLAVERDFVPFGFSGTGEADAEVVFAGYGITAGELDYDDYAGLDVSGKVVLLLRHEPQQNDPKSRFNGTSWSRHAWFRTKALNAQAHGAAAVLVFTGPLSEGYLGDRLTPLSGSEGTEGADIPALHVGNRLGEAMLASAGIDAEAWMRRVDETLTPDSRALPDSVTARVAVELDRDRRATTNVVGILRGADPAAGAVVLGAHYDHLGRGEEVRSLGARGKIHNGADDNASGTAALVELARVFAAGPRPLRSLVFVAFSGEELGLLGSREFTARPPLPLGGVQAMINLDMVGRADKDTVYVEGTGTSPAFPDLVDHLREGAGLGISTSEIAPGPSDHVSFADRDVPVLFFFTGMHENYHRPSDDWGRIDLPGLREVTALVYRATLDLAGRPDRIAFTEPRPRDD